MSGIDFAALRERSKVNAVKTAAHLQIQKLEPTWIERVTNLIDENLGELTEWEANFCYAQKQYLIANGKDAPLTERVRDKIVELEAMYRN